MFIFNLYFILGNIFLHQTQIELGLNQQPANSDINTLSDVTAVNVNRPRRLLGAIYYVLSRSVSWCCVQSLHY